MLKTYLSFNNECDDAIHTYVKAFDGEIVSIQRYGDLPPNPDFPVSEEMKNLVLHSCIKIAGDGLVYASDTQMEFLAGGRVSICVELDLEEAARKAWDVLKVDGEVEVELSPTFFAKLYGSVKDKFGITWQFIVGQF